jgi:hypothetical protein
VGDFVSWDPSEFENVIEDEYMLTDEARNSYQQWHIAGSNVQKLSNILVGLGEKCCL